MADITQKTLTVKLKELEEKNIIHREVFAQVPPKVVYSLTPAGQRLKGVFKEMYNWGISYATEHGEVSEEKEDVCCEAYIANKIGINK